MKRKAIILSVFAFILMFLLMPSAQAVRNQIPAETDGAVDLNNDGICSVDDVQMILDHIVHKELLEGEALKAADVNRDGAVNVTDATALRKVILYAKLPVTQVNLNMRSVTLYKNETAKLNGVAVPADAYDRELTYSSSDPQIATVDPDGLITAVSVGNAVVTVSATNGVSAECEVTVKERLVENVTLNTEAVYLYEGSETNLTWDIYPLNADDKTIVFSNSNPAVAVIDQNGKITAKSSGVTFIKATASSGVTADCVVCVYDRVVDYSKVYTSATVKRDCTVLEKLFPDLISYSSIGKSAKGDSIAMITLGKGSKKVCVTAGIHSREIVTSSFVMRCAEEYAKAYVSNSSYDGYNVRELLDEYTIYIVPACNPDGMDIYSANASPLYDYPNLSWQRLDYKANANGVNLNRNFPFYWDRITNGSIENRTNSNNTYKGSYAGSEPETQTLINLCSANRFEWMFSMHLRGDVVYWCDASNAVTEADRRLSSAIANKCGFYLMPASTDFNGYGGGYENYFRYRYGRPGFCVEIVPNSIPSPTYPGYYNSIFSTATRWTSTRCIFLEALSKT